ncbi:MAG TPA: SRPBCC family protein [Terriglobales bacterium]|nr:SRPBCC family protein [Terriglobales bacterium]
MRLETTGFLPSGNERTGDRYWGGFAAGALIGTAAAATAVMVANYLARNRDHRILRLEDSIQVARPVEEVFRAWSEFTNLPDYIDAIRNVQVQGTHSIWTVSANGKESRWEAETVQFIPNEAIGWKSVTGPKHTGRISFSPLGDQTIVHVTMNYASPLGRFTLLASPVSEVITSVVNEALRDFKAAMEGRGSRRSETGGHREPSTAAWRENKGSRKDVRLSEAERKEPASVDYTRPPQAKYP